MTEEEQMTEITITALTNQSEALDKRVFESDEDYADLGKHIADLFKTEPDCVKIEIVRGDDGSAAALDQAIAEGDPDSPLAPSKH